MFAENFGLAKIPPWASVAVSPLTRLKAQLVRNRLGGSAMSRLIHF